MTLPQKTSMKSLRYNICGNVLRRRGDSVENVNEINAVYVAEKFAETPHYPDRGVVWGALPQPPCKPAYLRVCIFAFFLNAKRALTRGNAESLREGLREFRCPRTQQVGRSYGR